MTGLAQRSSRLETSAPAATGASNAEPSSRVTKASATAAGRATCGGGAGSSSRAAASRTMASTTGAEHGEGHGPGVGRRRRRPRAGHRRGEPLELGSSSTSAGTQRTANSVGAGLAPLAPQRRHDRAAGDEAHAERRRRGPSQATLGPTLVVGAEAAADGDQPAERLLDRDATAPRRVVAAGERHVGVQAPAERRAADRLEPVGELVVVGRLGAAARPAQHHDLPGRPRRLQPDLPGRVLGDRLGRQLAAAQPGHRPRQPVALLLEVGHGQLALAAAEAADRLQVLLESGQEQGHHPPGRGGVAVDEVDLLRVARPSATAQTAISSSTVALLTMCAKRSLRPPGGGDPAGDVRGISEGPPDDLLTARLRAGHPATRIPHAAGSRVLARARPVIVVTGFGRVAAGLSGRRTSAARPTTSATKRTGGAGGAQRRAASCRQSSTSAATSAPSARRGVDQQLVVEAQHDPGVESAPAGPAPSPPTP